MFMRVPRIHVPPFQTLAIFVQIITILPIQLYPHRFFAFFILFVLLQHTSRSNIKRFFRKINTKSQPFSPVSDDCILFPVASGPEFDNVNIAIEI